jgi:nicotinate-nucleotide pyrophosphorylase (carboxylating)
MVYGLEAIIAGALNEDIGYGDISSQSTVAPGAMGRAAIAARESGVVAGLIAAKEVFHQVDASLAFSPRLEEGERCAKGDALCMIEGSARSILTGERVALNFLQRLSGIATMTAQFVELVKGTNARIVDTRKTTPGLRSLEKYAVRMGGGFNHRMGLFDAVMIKDNHIVAAGSITAAVQRARSQISHTVTITVECETLEQVDEALAAGADILLLDNMDNSTRADSVRRAKRRAITEASGGITLDSVEEVARTGVDIISVGALTHSAPALDIGLDFIDISLPEA